MVKKFNKKEYLKKYRQRPEAKSRKRELRQRPEAKKREKEYNKEYYQRPEIKTRRKDYRKEYLKRPEVKKRIREQEKEYRQRPKAKKYLREYAQKYQLDRKKTNINFKIRCYLRTRLWAALKKYTKTGKIMSSRKYGVDWKKVIEYLKPFPQDLANYEIDHRKPLCNFDLTNPKEIKKAFAPENHQWLTIHENRTKGGKE